MDDVIDQRTRLIYAALGDAELVRELEQARVSAVASGAPRPARGSRSRSGAVGTRPWRTNPGADRTDRTSRTSRTNDAMDVDVTSVAEPFVVDVRETEVPRAFVQAGAPLALPTVARQRSSEWSADDPSYYLG